MRLSILASSVACGYEDLLESIYALLDGFGYDVLMSHKGTVPIDPGHQRIPVALQWKVSHADNEGVNRAGRRIGERFTESSSGHARGSRATGRGA